MKLLNKERETKSKRLQLVIRPSLYDNLQRLKQLSGISVNEIVSQILEENVDPLIDAYTDYSQESPAE